MLGNLKGHSEFITEVMIPKPCFSENTIYNVFGSRESQKNSNNVDVQFIKFHSHSWNGKGVFISVLNLVDVLSRNFSLLLFLKSVLEENQDMVRCYPTSFQDGPRSFFILAVFLWLLTLLLHFTPFWMEVLTQSHSFFSPFASCEQSK